MREQPAMESVSKEEMLEVTAEFLSLLAAAKSIVRDLDRVSGKPEYEEVATSMAPEARVLADMIANTHRAWVRRGAFMNYFQVPSGAVHTTVACRTLSERTVLRPLPHLTGEPMEYVISEGYRMCSHCLKRPAEVRVAKAAVFCARWIRRLRNIP
ncbi:hypothetical protein [Mycobacterium sp. AZCC_0083]|uniref:hypothetical protein n=1 Tax=Mycobacterium sp. AZCC_0083 TaxID=2735882 RepID=UPI0016206275|nr:hypothetical protein [Mycobacterium sp. AZCC_0083]MBB5167094.1 hypothetical protein [Mycobacterium sp. AZCC_0083]